MKIAILKRNNFDFSQLGYYASSQINHFVKNYTDCNLVTCCLNNNQPAFKINTANIPLTELNSFSGIIITTCIDTTLFAKHLVRQSDIIHYVWDLEWLRAGNKDYFKNIEAYRDVLLAARSQLHALEIMKYTGVMTKIITPNFDIPTIINGYEQYRRENNRDVPTGG